MSFWLHFYSNRARTCLKRKRKKFVLCTVSAWPGLEHSQKNSKNKKWHSSFISSQTKVAQTEKEEKKKKSSFVLGIVSARLDWENSHKKILKIKKCHSGFISSQTGLGQADKEKIKFCSGYCFPLTRVGAIPTKFKKNSQKIKNLILASFLAKPSRERPKWERKKKVLGTVFAQPELQHS